MATVKSLETEVELLKREVTDMKQIHIRLDSAIEKIADVSSSLHTIMAVHEEKLLRQEEALEENEKEFRESVQELHSRITTNAKETSTQMGDMERRLVDAMNEHNRKETEQFMRLREELSTRVGVLEKWRYLIIGGSIVLGFALTEILPIFM
jgi:predicted  nucleic acid-binding Zn-ribbon protein|tara:strand:- start:1615 stop:2070 length:456 start_codon:yes stop_codon:yes gene_type:complete